MARIPIIEPQIMGLHPSSAGESAWREAGVLAGRYASQAAEQVREEGAEFGRVASEAGRAIAQVGENVQQHNDTAAWLEAMKDGTANDIATLDAIQGVGTDRKDADGNPAPSTAAFNAGTGDILENYSQLQAGELEKFKASGGLFGVSDKALERFQLHQAERLKSITLKAHGEAIAVAGQEAVGNVNMAVNTLAATVDKHPELLEASIGQYDTQVDELTRALGRVNAAQTVGPKAIEGKATLVTTAIFSYARAGQLDQAQRLIDDPKWAPFIGKHIETIKDKVDGITQARIRQQNSIDKQNSDKLADDQQQAVDKVFRNLQQPTEKQDPNLTRQSLETNPLFVGHPEDLKKARKTLDDLELGTTDPNQSRTIGEGLSRKITSGEITSPAQIDAAVWDGNGHRRMTPQDEAQAKAELKDVLANPATKGFYSELKDWTVKNAPLIDRSMVDKDTGMVIPGAKSDLGQRKLDQWESEVKRRARIMSAKGEDPHLLLDPNYKDSMVSPQALLPYRVTADQAKADALKQQQLDQGKPIQLTPEDMKQDPKEIMKNFSPGTKLEYNPGFFGGPTRHFTVPGTPARQMNLMQEQQPKSNPALGAINDALAKTVDAHLDKNLFSSGRYQDLGIKGGVGANLTMIEAQGHAIPVNSAAAPHFKAFLDELTRMGYKIDELAGYNDRNKKGGMTKSEHAFGNAIDINEAKNPFHSMRDNMPPNISLIAARYGLIWGGDWRGSSRDPMHFEWSGKGGSTQEAQAR